MRDTSLLAVRRSACSQALSGDKITIGHVGQMATGAIAILAATLLVEWSRFSEASRPPQQRRKSRKRSNRFRDRGEPVVADSFRYRSPDGDVTGVAFSTCLVCRQAPCALRESVQRRDHWGTPGPKLFGFSREARIETAARPWGDSAVEASREQEIDAALAAMVRAGVGALLVGAGPSFVVDEAN